MKAAAVNQLTFLSCGTLLAHLSERCLVAERLLRTLPGSVGERDFQLVELVADTEHGLAIDLANFAENAPKGLASTRVQYALDEQAPARPDTLEEALEGVTIVNQQLSSTLHDLKQKTAPDTLSEFLDTLCNEIDAVNRRISNIRNTARDL